MSARLVVIAVIVVGGLSLPTRDARAMGDADRFDITALSFNQGGTAAPDTLSGIDRVAWELEKRTSVRSAAHAPVLEPRDPQLRRHPLLVLRGRGALPPLDERSLDALRGHLEAGGLLFIDGADAERPLDDDPFDRDVRELARRLFPRGALEKIPRDHVIYKTYYLVGTPVGRRARSPVLEGVAIDGRLAIVYSRNDILGALARDRLGAFQFGVEPGGETQREQALRMAVNIVMYALCLDYKADQVHAPFLLQRRRSGP